MREVDGLMPQTLALGVRPPAIDFAGTLSTVSQIRRNQVAETATLAELRRAERAERRTEAQRAALAKYGPAVMRGDAEARASLAEYPSALAPLVNIQSTLAAQGRAASAEKRAAEKHGLEVTALRDQQKRNRIARAAAGVFGVKEEDRPKAFEAAINELLTEGEIDEGLAAQARQQGPTLLFLQSLMGQALTPEQMTERFGPDAELERRATEAAIGASEAQAEKYEAEAAETRAETARGGKLTENERKIRSLTDRDVPRADAEDIVYGFVQVVTDPTLKAPVLVNKVTNEARALPTGVTLPEDVETVQADQPESLYEMAPQATGLRRTIQEGLTEIGPQFSPIEVRGYPETVEARQEFGVAVNELIRALSINPRFPVGEINRIKSEIDIEPRWFRSTEALEAKMRGVDTGLRVRLENERETSQNPELPSDVRANALQAANDIENFLDRLGVPRGGSAESEAGTVDNPARPMTDEEFAELPVGAFYIDPDDGQLYTKDKP